MAGTLDDGAMRTFKLLMCVIKLTATMPICHATFSDE